MARFILTNKPEEVCRRRAAAAADLDFLDKIKEAKDKYDKTRNPKFFQESYMLVRQRALKEEEYYNDFLKNYEIKNDSFSSFNPDSDISLSDFNNIMKDLLNNI